MTNHRKPTTHRAFTLIEMLVVIAIIALLLAALLPAFSVVRTKAKIAVTQGQFGALDTSINLYRAEKAMGGGLPPSATDNPSDRLTIADPSETAAGKDVLVAGAQLLVQAMIGADGLGPPGFRDVSKPKDGEWWDNTHKGQDGGIYYINETTGSVEYPRYGEGGYVDEKMRARAKSLEDLYDSGMVINYDPNGNFAGDAPMFVDAFGTPILYYKARPTSLKLIGNSEGPGIYYQEDNGIITGTENGTVPQQEGLDFGAGPDEHDFYHLIHDAVSPKPTDKIDEILDDPNYVHTFALFIMDPSIKARPTPARKDSYLLISAGPDGRYGSDDDVLNWTPKSD